MIFLQRTFGKIPSKTWSGELSDTISKVQMSVLGKLPPEQLLGGIRPDRYCLRWELSGLELSQLGIAIG